MTLPAAGRVSPYAPPVCAARYRGVLSSEPLFCARREHTGKGSQLPDPVHRAELPPLRPGGPTRPVSWL